MNIQKKLYYFLTPNEKKKGGYLLVMIFIMGLLDVFGVASIMPFIAVVSNPVIIETNIYLNNLFELSNLIGVKTTKEFIFLLALLVFGILIFSLFFKAMTNYFLFKFVHMIEYSISKRLMEGYISQPYSWFLNRNSLELGKNILSEVSMLTHQALLPVMNLISNSVIVFLIINLLMLVNLKLALTVVLVIGGAYLIFYKLSQNFLKNIGKNRYDSNELRFKELNEAFGAFKEVKLDKLEEAFIKRFSIPAKMHAKNIALSHIFNNLPRFAIEAVAFGGLLLLIILIISREGNLNNALPFIGLYAFAGYKLMPSLQLIYSAGTNLKFAEQTINSLHGNLHTIKKKIIQKQTTLSFSKNINLKNITYNYPETSRTVLKNINLTIPIRKIVGIVGTTGSGKSTLVDIILGLLEPKEGKIEIDGQILKEDNLRSWQNLIGYVPQDIYLSDDTIARNIAFGIEQKNIDKKSIERASKIANLHEFVLNELPSKYETIIGERGTRLSGGQKQRIGIARALYKNPNILILDEATSALDNQTEKAVIDSINNLNKKITIIMVAHRLNTMKSCDFIIKLENGIVTSKLNSDEFLTT